MLIPFVVVALFGLAFGSFLNVCIFRLIRKDPQGHPAPESIVTPRSHCPRCGRPIRWYDNIPVVSYLLLGGRCRDCHARISIIYPLVEILCAGVLVAAFLQYGLSPQFVKYGVLGMLLLVLIFTDLLERRIPQAVTVFGIGLGFLLSLIVPVDHRLVEWGLSWMGVFPDGAFASVLGAFAGAMFGGGLLYAVGQAFHYATGQEGLGWGDVMLMLMVGVFLGVEATLLTVLLGSLLGTAIALPLEFSSARFRRHQWPYGSFLGAAGIYASLGGKALRDWYESTQRLSAFQSTLLLVATILIGGLLLVVLRHRRKT